MFSAKIHQRLTNRFSGLHDRWCGRWFLLLDFNAHDFLAAPDKPVAREDVSYRL